MARWPLAVVLLVSCASAPARQPHWERDDTRPAPPPKTHACGTEGPRPPVAVNGIPRCVAAIRDWRDCLSNDSLGLVQRVAGFPLGITRAEFRERCLAHGGVPRGDGCNFGGADAEVWATGRWARCGERLELLLVYFRRASGALAKIAEDACDEVGGPTRLSVSCGTGQNRVLEWDWGAITLRLDLDRCSVFPNMEVRADECAGLDALPPPGQTRTPWWIPPAAAGVGR